MSADIRFCVLPVIATEMNARHTSVGLVCLVFNDRVVRSGMLALTDLDLPFFYDSVQPDASILCDDRVRACWQCGFK